MPSVGIIGAGLAGSEAALVLARNKISVTLYEMRPDKTTPAHATGLPAELVCSNSLKSWEPPGAQALLKDELSCLKSPLLVCAKKTAVPAGKALAVNRKDFSMAVLSELRQSPFIAMETREIARPPGNHDAVIIATGPLSSSAIVEWLTQTFSSTSLYFYDAVAPIVATQSIDMRKAFAGSRWRPEQTDYLNCPFTEEEYKAFYDALVSAKTVPPHVFEEERFFEACLPLEIIAGRGYQAMAYGPLKPVGFASPSTGKRPFALCQLRRENAEGESYSLVACQSRMTQPEQDRVFRIVPGLEHAEFLRYGSCHRNTYLCAPDLLAPDLSFSAMPGLFCAGQLCGNEGYVESIATGHLAALFALFRLARKSLEAPPVTTALGALLRYITVSTERPFSPTGFHYGLLPPPGTAPARKMPKKERQMLLCARALADLKQWIEKSGVVRDSTFYF
jgi:methylenetetrahydrofolate--tRNA-(uracil-5-)-methyltransferase